jgi:hypothetical protein
MSMPSYEDPASSRPRPKVDAGRLWTGGVATAAVNLAIGGHRVAGLEHRPERRAGRERLGCPRAGRERACLLASQPPSWTLTP